ncbi:MAG: sodium/solute symporter [Planctomycetaceae bacterium]|nr:sodium/solute symporter [Planctomycetaceae bacterium]
MSGSLTQADYLLILAYLVGTVALGVIIGRRIKTGTDFFLAGRSLPWWAVGMSLVATDIGGTDIIGVGGAAYTHGMAVANFEWIGCVPAMIVAAFVFIPFFYRTGVYTVPEYMERRYNAGVRSALALCWLIFMACNLGIMLLASGKMMATLVGWNTTFCIGITAVLVGMYTLTGGLAAVVYTDAIQCTVMIGGCLLVTVLGVWDLGGLAGLQELTSPEQRQLILPADSPTPFPWPGILFGLALVLSPAYWIGNQAIIQRSLGAESEFAAKASYVWGAVLKNLIPLIIAVPGLVAAAKFPDLADGDLAYPLLVSTLLPAGLKGLFVAAFIAALMSSVDSYLNSAATILTVDLYQRFVRPQATDRQLLTIGRVTTALLLGWAVVFAMFLARMNEQSGIYAIFQTLMAFFQGPALAILLCGVLWRRATGTAALLGFLCGIACSISLFTLGQPGVAARLGWQPLFQVSEPFLYFSIWAFLFTLSIVIVVSWLTRAEPPEKMQYVLGRRAAASEGVGS